MIVELLIVRVESKLAERELRKAAKLAPLRLAHHSRESFSAESRAPEQREIRGVMQREVVSRDRSLLSPGERILHHFAYDATRHSLRRS